MSGTVLTGNPTYASYSTDPLTSAEKIDIRRFCGYPAYGIGQAGFVGYRFFQAYGTLEYRMNNGAPGEYQVMRGILAQTYVLETAIPSASINLDTDQAAVWYHNKHEVRDRMMLFDTWRIQLCAFFEVPPGPFFRIGNRNNLTMVV